MKLSLKMTVLLLLFAFTAQAQVQPEMEIKVTISPEYQIIHKGDFIVTQVVLSIPTDGETVKEVILEYTVMDLQKKIITQFMETRKIASELNLIKEVTLPESLKADIYVLEVKASYKNKTSADTALFEMEDLKSANPTPNYTLLYSVIVGALLCILVGIFLAAKKLIK